MAGVHRVENVTTVWKSLVETCLPLGLNRDVDFWWDLTGRHMAQMVEAAGYSVERQYEILLFHYHWIVPRLGPAADADGRATWHSLMAHDGSPLEYSWKWNTTTSEPDIRYSWEPFNPGAESTRNTENHAFSLDYMDKVPRVAPDADFTWARYFLAELENDNDQPALRFLHAVEFNRTKNFGLKSYFLPRAYKLLEGGDSGTMAEWDAAVMKLDPTNAGRKTLMEYLAKNSEGQLLTPVVLAMDDVSPKKSRLKLYFTTPHTSFASLRDIMTLGGKINILEASLQDLRSFINTILGLPADYPESAETPVGDKTDQWVKDEVLVPCFVYFFDVAPATATVDIKFYLPTRTYGPDDLEIARRLSRWMDIQGRGKYCERYIRMMEAIAEHRGLGAGKGMHSYLSYQFGKNGSEPDVKSYFTPEAYHPKRYI